MHRFVSRFLRSPIPIALALAFTVLLTSACNALVVEPVDESGFYQQNIKFWGYSVNPSEPVRLEAQSTAWEVLATTTSASVPTHASGSTGYYFEFNYYGPNVPTRFRKTSPYSSSGYWRTFFRVSNNNGQAVTRQYQHNGSNSTSGNWLEEFWSEHATVFTTSHLRIDIHP